MAMGLVPPEVPVANNIANENFLRGFSLIAGIAQQRRENELAIQQLAQQDKLREEQFKIERERMVQDAPLISAQTDTQKAMADLHRQQTRESIDGVRTASQIRTSRLKQVGEYARAVGNITEPVGTQAWQDRFDLVSNDPMWADIRGSTEFQRVWNSHLQEHNKTATQNRITHNAVENQVTSFLKNTGLPLGAFKNDKDWTYKKDTNEYYLNQDLKTGAIAPSNADVTAHPDQYRSITLPADRYKFYKEAVSHVENALKHNLFPPSPETIRQPVTSPSTIPVVQTDDDYDAIQSGSVYVDPTGVTRKKP